MTEPNGSSRVSKAEIRAQLEKVLSAETFARAAFEPALALLGKALARDGRGVHQGICARGRGFRPGQVPSNPRADTIVRVQARRVRTRLAHYYETEGRADRCVIEIPKGGYQPEFHAREPLPAAPVPANGHVDRETHRLVLEGRVLVNQGTPAKLLEAVSLFEKAVNRDPRYAPAYSEIGHAHVQLSSLHCTPREAMPKARQAALRALGLDDSLDQAYADER